MVSFILFRMRVFALYTALLPLTLVGCASLPSTGPSSGTIQSSKDYRGHEIPVVELSVDVIQQLSALDKREAFAQVFANGGGGGYVVGPGDVLQITIWEASPAALFGATSMSSRSMMMAPSGPAALPEQMVESDGTINVPFAGEGIQIAGKTMHEVEQEIVKRLRGRANQPQVMARVVRNATSVVTVVGEVNQNINMPLTAKGEHLLDAMAAAGGVKQPVGKITIRLTRGDQVYAMPLDAIIQDPKQNIPLRPGDVVTALYQPYSFTALGAVLKNDEVFFEAQGITLAQALGRVGGLDDNRADARGAFIFRFENKGLAEKITNRKDLPATQDGKVPMVYRIDLKNPATFLLAQNFSIHNRDVIYVSNASMAELQKFLNILVSAIVPVASLKTLGVIK